MNAKIKEYQVSKRPAVRKSGKWSELSEQSCHYDWNLITFLWSGNNTAMNEMEPSWGSYAKEI